MKTLLAIVIFVIVGIQGIAMHYNFTHDRTWAAISNAGTLILVAVFAKICGNLLTIAGL